MVIVIIFEIILEKFPRKNFSKKSKKQLTFVCGRGIILIVAERCDRNASVFLPQVAQTTHTCDCGGIGRRARLRGVWATVPVQVRPVAPICRCGGMADALASGASVRKDVRVQVPPSAPNTIESRSCNKRRDAMQMWRNGRRASFRC